MLGIYDMNIDTVLGYKDRLDIYKQSGFGEVSLYLDSRYQREGEDYVDIINYAREIGLDIKQVHIDYKISNLIAEDIDAYCDYVASKLKESLALGITYVVAHASKGDTPPVVDDRELNILKKMMKSFENEPIFLCLENVRNNENLDRVLSLGLPNIKVCFDLGHAHAYGDETTIYERYKARIICSHIHNNYGSDTHNIPSLGDIRVSDFVHSLSQISNSSNCLECFPTKEDGKPLQRSEFVSFVDKCYEWLRENCL